MNPIVSAVALALVGSLPAALLAFGAGLLIDRLTRDPRLRERAWTLMFALPALLVGVAVLAVAAPGEPDAAARSPGLTEVIVTVREVVAAPEGPAGPSLPPLAAAVVGASVAGLVVRLALWARGTRRLRAVVRRAAPLRRAEPGRLLASAARRLRRPILPVLVSDEVDRPLLAGLRRHAMLLPRDFAERCGEAELALVCTHELAHAARGDNLRLAIEAAVEGAFWFNPWVGAIRVRLWAAREEVCDAIALADAPPPVRRAYAETLIEALRLSAGPGPQTAFTGARKRTPAMRLNSILRPAEPASRSARTAAAAVVGVAVMAGAAGAAALESMIASPAASQPPAGGSAGDAALTSRLSAADPMSPASMAAILAAEPRDPAWAEPMERLLREAFAEAPPNGERLHFSVVCKSTMCEVATVVRPASNTAELINAIMRDFSADGARVAANFRSEALTAFGPAPEHPGRDMMWAYFFSRSAPADHPGVRAIRNAMAAQEAQPSWSETRPRTSAAAEQDGPLILNPEWTQRPTGAEVAAAYPAQALRNGVSGRATLECLVQTAGGLGGCKVLSEAPEDAGFGAAALGLVPRFAIKPLGPSSAGKVRLPILFQAPAASAPIPQLTPDDQHPVTIVADRVSEVRLPSGRKIVYAGRVEIRTAARRPSYPIRVNDRPPADDFFLGGLDAARTDRVEMIFGADGRLSGIDIYTR